MLALALPGSSMEASFLPSTRLVEFFSYVEHCIRTYSIAVTLA